MVNTSGKVANQNRIETGVGPITDQLLNTIIEKMNSESFKTTLTAKLLDPISDIINEKMRPYIRLSVILYSVIIILLIIIICLLVFKKSK